MSAVVTAGVPVTVAGVSVLLGRERRAVDDASLTVAPGSWTTIIGPNGAGKTTLLRAIAGLVPFEGSVRLGEHEVAALRTDARARMVALMPQTPVLPPGMRVLDYVLLGRTAYLGRGFRPTSADVEIARSVMSDLALDDFAGREVAALSGGETQRVVMARALTQQPDVLLLDEPTTALDLGHQQEVLDLVDTQRRTRGLTVIATLHDIGLAAQYSTAMVLMNHARVVEAGTPRDVIREDVLERVYGARVRVIDDPDGLIVVPLRIQPDATSTTRSSP